MQRLAKPIEFDTAFETYTATALLGEGGAGRVYHATNAIGERFAIKVVANASSEKRRRFKNEVGFLRRMSPHPNIVQWTADGSSRDSRAPGPFYVMPCYEGSLRDLLKARVAAQDAQGLFAQILAGVEVAHQQRAVHRDLKPENVLYKHNGANVVLAVADFGIAQFHPDDQETLVQTKVGTRLANFEYHAPEQRRAGGSIDARTDIFALGMMLNEIFTGEVPRGTGFKRIAEVAQEYAYLDELVEAMMQSTPGSRPESIVEVRRSLRLLHERAMTSRQIAALPTSITVENPTEDPLISDPPRLVDAKWAEDATTLTLSRPVNDRWIECLRGRMGSWESVMGVGPEAFHFTGNIARASVGDSDAQRVINYFMAWIPKATAAYAHHVEEARRYAAQEEMDRIRREHERLELTRRVNASLSI